MIIIHLLDFIYLCKGQFLFFNIHHLDRQQKISVAQTFFGELAAIGDLFTIGLISPVLRAPFGGSHAIIQEPPRLAAAAHLAKKRW